MNLLARSSLLLGHGPSITKVVPDGRSTMGSWYLMFVPSRKTSYVVELEQESLGPIVWPSVGSKLRGIGHCPCMGG